MQWLIVGVVLFLIFVTKTGGAGKPVAMATTQQPTNTPQPNPLRPTGQTTPTSAAKSGVGISAILGIASTVFGYIKKAYSAITTGTQIYTAATLPSEVASVGADTASGIDATVNAGLAAGAEGPADTVGSAAGIGAAAGATATGELGGTTVSYVAGTASSTVAAVVGETAAGVIGTAALGVGFLSLAFIIRDLINLGLNDYKTGQISKEIMRQRQIYIMQQGSAKIEAAIAAAATFTDAANILLHAPAGTSGQIQFGIGAEFAGVNLNGVAGTTETPNWSQIVKAMADPVTLREHPEAIANFIANLWVQTGPGGATWFDQRNTWLFRLNLLSKLPYTPEWNFIKTIILNMPMVDPRDIVARNAAIDATPIPPEDNFLRIGWAKVPTDRQYMFYNIYSTPPSWRTASPEEVAYNLEAIPPEQPWAAGTAPSLQGYIYDPATGLYSPVPVYDYAGYSGA